MPRATNNVASRRRRRKIMRRAAGFRHGRSRLFRTAKDAVTKSLQYAYRDRRKRKGAFRRLWISRINAACRLNGTKYSRLINDLNRSGVSLDRKMLAELAATDPAAFTHIVEATRS
jgi:large subunit ribosomal protein L20